MVETALRPRPEFSTFFLSDQNAKGDGLCLYQHKKLLRAQKVVILQQKQLAARVPGCKPPVHRDHIEQPRQKSTNAFSNAETQTTPYHEQKTQKLIEGAKKNADKDEVVLQPQQTSLTARVQKPSPGHVPSYQRVKSATSYRSPDKKQVHKENLHRPRTAGEWQSCNHHQQQRKPQGRSAIQEPCHVDDIEDVPLPALHLEDEPTLKEPDINSLAKSYSWATSTKRAYNEVGWENKLQSYTTNAPPPSTFNVPPDPVSLRFVNKRNQLYPQEWQCLGSAWDVVQSRLISIYNRPKDKNTFCSPFRHNRKIPGYQGCTPGDTSADLTEGNHNPLNNVHCHQPRPTKISRHSNIPGYTGCTLWSSDKPAYANMGYPKKTTNTRTFGPHPIDENVSPFVKNGVLSKMISLNAPYNPFNKIEH